MGVSMGINPLVLTEKHVDRLHCLDRWTNGNRGDIRHKIDEDLIAWGYARRYAPFNLSHRLRTVLTEKGRAVIGEVK